MLAVDTMGSQFSCLQEILKNRRLSSARYVVALTEMQQMTAMRPRPPATKSYYI